MDHRSTALLVLATLAAVGAAVGITLALAVAFSGTLSAAPVPAAPSARNAGDRSTCSSPLPSVSPLACSCARVAPRTSRSRSVWALSSATSCFYATASPLRRGWLWAALVAALGITLLRANALSYYPAYNINDEPWVMDWALSYARYGAFTHMIMVYGGGDIHRIMIPVAWWISLIGEGFLADAPVLLPRHPARHRLHRAGCPQQVLN